MSGFAPVAIGVDRSSDAGHIVELTRQDEVGDRESEWMNEYGWVWRVKHCLGVLSLATMACPVFSRPLLYRETFSSSSTRRYATSLYTSTCSLTHVHLGLASYLQIWLWLLSYDRLQVHLMDAHGRERTLH